MTEVAKPVEVSSKGKGWLYAIVAAGGLLVYSFVTGSNPLALLKFSSGGWLIAGLLVSAGVLIGGEYLIKKWALTDFSAKTARAGFYFAAIVVAGFGIFQTMSGGINVPNMGPSYLHQLMQMFGFATPPWWLYLVIWFAAGSIAVMFFVGVYHHFQDGAPAVTKGTTTLLLTGAIILLLMWMVLGPTRTGQAITAVQNGAQNQFDGLLAGGKIEIDWSMVALGLLGLFALLGLWKKDKIRTAAMILAAIIWLPLIAWQAIRALPVEFKADVSALTAPVTNTYKAWTKPAPPPAPPAPKPWVQGSTITIDRTYDMTRVMPTEGVIFDQPSYCNVEAQGIDGIVPLFTGAGPENNIWSKTLVRPRMGQPQEMRVTVVCSD